jgi:hypothetical protein
LDKLLHGKSLEECAACKNKKGPKGRGASRHGLIDGTLSRNALVLICRNAATLERH